LDIEREILENSNLDVVMWWKLNEKLFPYLCIVVRFILGYLPASAVVESLFSENSKIRTKERLSIAPERVDNLLTCRSNFDLLEDVSKEAANESKED
jgi:hypothetical protein